MRKIYLLFFTSISLMVNVANAAIHYVKQGASGGGTSWADAAGNLQGVINASVAGDEIWVAAGTYYPQEAFPGTTTSGSYPIGNRDKTFLLKKDVKIYGGFFGNETTLVDRDYAANITILSGDLNTDNTASGNSYHVVMSVGDVGTAVLDGFTITEGYGSLTVTTTLTASNIDTYRAYGAGIYINSSSPVLKNLVVDGNAVQNGAGSVLGGGIYASNSAAQFSNVRVSNNTATYTSAAGTGGAYGGGIYIVGSTGIVFDNLEITGNQSLSNTGNSNAKLYGGGLYITSSSVTINKGSIMANNATDRGAGIYINGVATGGESSTFSDLLIQDNGSGTGTGVYNYASSSQFKNIRFIGNDASVSGSAFYNGGGGASEIAAPVLTNCLFFDNEAGSSTYGGAIYISTFSQMKVVNSTFYHNINTNSSNTNGGGAVAFFSSGSSNTISLSLHNDIFYDNTGDFYKADADATLDIKNSIVQTTVGATNGVNGNLVGVNPEFSSIAFGDGDFLNLSSASPAVNAGNELLRTPGITLDLAGNPRVLGAELDMGAFEYQGTLPVSLASYTASKKPMGVMLQWTTLSEKDNDYFIIERSGDGKLFTQLETVLSKGDSDIKLNYSFLDASPLAGKNYYRLSQKDKDGKLTEKAILVIDFGLSANATVVYPNPVADEFSIKLSDPSENLFVQISDMQGKVILSKAVKYGNGLTTIKLNSQVIPGQYIILVKTDKLAERKLITVIR